MKRIIIHAGMNKTGSTVIQKFLLKNKAALKAQGVLYPESGLVNSGHHALAWSMGMGKPIRPNPKADLKNSFKNLRKEILKTNCSTILISSEYFCKASTKEIKKINRFFSSFGSVDAVFVIRRQDKWLESLYAEAVKSLICKRNIEEFYLKRTSDLDYYQMLKQWGGNVGSIRIVPYQEKSKNIEFEFSESIGLDTTGFEKIMGSNVSLSPKGLALMRLLPRKEEFSQIEHEKIIRAVRKINFNSPRMGLLSPEFREVILNEFRSINDKVEHEFLDGNELFTYEQASEEEWVRPDELKSSDFDLLFDHLRKLRGDQISAKVLVSGLVEEE